MARRARLCIPHLPHLLKLVAVPGARPLACDEARERLLATLVQGLQRFAVRLHAYCLLPDAVYMLATPEDAPALSGLMQMLARRASRGSAQDERVATAAGPAARAELTHGERANEAPGTRDEARGSGRSAVWAGRFRSAVLEPQLWALSAMVWVDTAAQRAGVAAAAPIWAWSSAGVHCGQAGPRGGTPALHLPAAYWALGNTPFEREAAYARMVQAGLGASEGVALERALRAGLALGDAGFVAELEQAAGRRLQPGVRGRPRK
ncbi:hypothetical protein [Thiomonas sp. FB-Cd]|uniref:hypothetical protein n=1 Tax=Thiomonas sp. FB-Cd TaxID=1158292 RepID=UPI00056E5D87|nr:hypothetical protein [Thiomonas sp. FB-Cd]